jgi:hypothetical protein
VGVRVEDEFAAEFAGGGVEHADVEVLDQDEDVGSGVGSADAAGLEPALVAQGDFAPLVDPVVADSVVDVAAAVAGAGLGPAAGSWHVTGMPYGACRVEL